LAGGLQGRVLLNDAFKAARERIELPIACFAKQDFDDFVVRLNGYGKTAGSGVSRGMSFRRRGNTATIWLSNGQFLRADEDISMLGAIYIKVSVCTCSITP
jgi:hypothetical protein